jgi:hypothetical protein
MSNDSVPDSIADLLPFVSWYDQVETEYREQLGAALLAFNRIENDVSELIASVLQQRDRRDLIGPTLNKQLTARVEALDLLLTSEPKFPRVPVDRIKDLAGKRNNFAYGHFTFDPNTSDPIIKGKGKSVLWDDQSIEPFMIEARDLHDELTTLCLGGFWARPGTAPSWCDC